MAPLSLKIILDEGAVTRTVKFDSSTKVADAYDIIKEKILTADDGKEYGLFLTSADNEQSGIWLEARRPLDYYMLRSGDSLLYLNRRRNLRIRMLDGSVKTLQVDESKNIGDLMMAICVKIGIVNHDEYGLCQEESMEQDEGKENKPATGTLTLKRKAQHRERDAKMDELSKKLKTDDNVDWLDQHKTLREVGVDPTETLLLKRRLFYSDRNVDSRDPVQLNLLYVQTRDAILNGHHPVTEDQAAVCKLRWVHIRDVHRRIMRKIITQPDSKVRLYKYDSELSFMRPFYKEIVIDNDVMQFYEHDEDNDDHTACTDEIINNQQLEDDQMDNTDAESDETNKPVKKSKRKRSTLVKRSSKKKKNVEEENKLENITSNDDVVPIQMDPKDPVDAFLLSIGATMKTFSLYHLNIAKSKIFSVVQEHEMLQIDHPPHKSTDAKVSTSNYDHNMYSC